VLDGTLKAEFYSERGKWQGKGESDED